MHSSENAKRCLAASLRGLTVKVQDCENQRSKTQPDVGIPIVSQEKAIGIGRHHIDPYDIF